jgi:hypothetical protein
MPSIAVVVMVDCETLGFAGCALADETHTALVFIQAPVDFAIDAERLLNPVGMSHL